MQRKEGNAHNGKSGSHPSDASAGIESSIKSLGGGRPLSSSERAYFEPRFERDFGDVRVHTDSSAGDAAKLINATAFTLGNDIVFKNGEYSPKNKEGQRLLAHELTHVVQQSVQTSAVIRRDGPFSGGQTQAGTQTPEEERRPAQGSPVLWFRGVPLAEDEEFVRQEMRRLIGREGLENADSWYRAMQGRPDATMPLPFSAHARAFGGLRVRGPLDVIRDLDQETLRLRYAPLVARVYREVRAEAVAYLQEFEGRARGVALSVLQESEARVNAERIRYGLERETHQVETYRPCGRDEVCATTRTAYSHRMSDTLSSQGLVGAARDLQAKQSEIGTLLSERQRLVRTEMRRSFGNEYIEVEHITDEARYQDLTRQAEDKRREHDLMLQLFSQRYPILASYANNPGAIAGIANSGISPVTAGILNQQIYETLDNITTVRSELVPNGEVDIWQLPEIILLTKMRTGAVGDTVVGRMRARIVDDEVRHIRRVRRWTNIALAVLAIGLSVIAAIPSGGSSLVAGATAVAGLGAAGLSFFQAARHLHEYQMESAMAGTDFDRARAISSEEPSLFWLGVDILGALLDVAPALRGTRQLLQVGQRTFHALAGNVQRAIAARGADLAESLAALRRAAEGVEFGGTRLIARIEQTVQRIRQAGGSAERALAGAAGHEAAAVERASAEIARESEHVLAQAPTRLGGHTVKVTPSGWLVRCSLCGQLREEFASELARNHDLARRCFATEEKAARAARTGDRALATEAAQEGRQLADELEALRREVASDVEIDRLRQLARSDPDAAWELIERYENMTDLELCRRFAEFEDETAAAILRQKYPSNEAALRKVLGSTYRPPHSAVAILERNGRVVLRQELQSGGMKDLPTEIRALGFRRAAAATHTEAKAVRQIELHNGDVLEIRGQYDPCTSCRQAMQEAATRTGATIRYWWQGGSVVFRRPP